MQRKNRFSECINTALGDDPALTFAETFYANVIAGLPLGPAITKARLAVQEGGSADWADYIHYGSPNFVLKPRPV